MLDIQCLTNIVFIGTTLSIASRVGFSIVIWRNKSTNPISMGICMTNVVANGFWIPYALQTRNTPILLRSVSDMIISFVSMCYILRNRGRMMHPPAPKIDAPTHEMRIIVRTPD